MNKKNNSIFIIIAVIILAVIAIIILKVGIKKPAPQSQSLNQTDIELNQAVTSDTTKSISDNINSINVDEELGTDELDTVDQELEKL